MVDRPSSPTRPRRRWHELLEHYTPNGTLGRLLFGAISGSASALSFSLAAISFTSYGLPWLILGLAATVTASVAAVMTLVVLWPIYLSLIGNVASPESYAEEGAAVTGESADDPMAILKRRYAEGSMGDDEFERRLDTLLDAEVGSQSDSTNCARSEATGVREYERN